MISTAFGKKRQPAQKRSKKTPPSCVVGGGKLPKLALLGKAL
jgi:hypothetical protein